jgi:deoxyadenosine/deoxycytidine kinase
MKHDMTTLISIGGNIGSGKSTLIQSLTETAGISHSVQKNWTILSEPIERWGPWLKLFYDDMVKHAFGFQMKVMYEYMFVKALSKKKNVITERSPMDSVFVFGNHLQEKGVLQDHEYNLLKQFYQEIGWRPHIYIYISSDPEVCYNRIAERKRQCESDISLDYLIELNRHYETFVKSLQNVPIDMKLYIVDGNKTKDELFSEVMSILANTSPSPSTSRLSR